MKKMMLGIALRMVTSDLLTWALEMYIFPPMRRFVKKSSNKYDDKALKHAESFMRDLAADYDNLKKEG